MRGPHSYTFFSLREAHSYTRSFNLRVTSKRGGEGGRCGVFISSVGKETTAEPRVGGRSLIWSREGSEEKGRTPQHSSACLPASPVSGREGALGQKDRVSRRKGQAGGVTGGGYRTRPGRGLGRNEREK